jgi:hypothetical protein
MHVALYIAEGLERNTRRSLVPVHSFKRQSNIRGMMLLLAAVLVAAKVSPVGAQASYPGISGATRPYSSLVAEAGPTQCVPPGTAVTLRGTSLYDMNGADLSFGWEQIEGPAVSLNDADTHQASFTAPMVGPNGASLAFELTVRDTDGTVDSDICWVNIAGTNQAPVADAGEMQNIDEGTLMVTLNGSGSYDPDHDEITFVWRQVGMQTVDLLDAHTAMPRFVVPHVGPEGESLTFELTVTDSANRIAVATCRVNIIAENAAPAAVIRDDPRVREGDAVTLDGSASFDPDGDQLGFVWRQLKGPPVAVADRTAASLRFMAPVVNVPAEALHFELTVIDPGGLRSSAVCAVVVHGAMQDVLLGEKASAGNPTGAAPRIGDRLDDASGQDRQYLRKKAQRPWWRKMLREYRLQRRAATQQYNLLRQRARTLRHNHPELARKMLRKAEVRKQLARDYARRIRKLRAAINAIKTENLKRYPIDYPTAAEVFATY